MITVLDINQRPKEYPKKPRELGCVLSMMALPLLLLAGVLSIPWLAVASIYYWQREIRFAKKMRQAGRIMDASNFAKAIDQRRGTVIVEWFSEKGPVRYWWTQDDIPSISSLTSAKSGADAIWGGEHDAFSSWCHQNYVANEKTLLVPSSYLPKRLSVTPSDSEGFPLPLVAIYVGRLSTERKSKQSP